MTREERIVEVNDLSKQINKPIPVARYIRQRIVQEEIIDAYKSPVPSAVTINNKPKMVETGDWIIIKEDGSQDTCKPVEFAQVFEPYREEANERRK